MSTDTKPAASAPMEAIHLCSVPTEQLPHLVEHRPVIDLDRYEFGRRLVGPLLSAQVQPDGSVIGTLELRYSRPDPNRPGQRQHLTSTAGFRIEAGHARVGAHLRASVLQATPGAVDVEFG